MAAGGIVGVDALDADKGIYRAQLDGGGSFLLHGAPGEKLFERYKPKEATSPEALADAGKVRMGTTTVSEPTRQPEEATDAPVRMGTTTVSAPRGGQVEPEAAGGNSFQRGVAASMQESDVPQNPPVEAPKQTGPRPLGYTMEGVDPVTGKKVTGPAIDMGGGQIGIALPGSKGSAGGLTTLGKEALEHDKAAEAELTRQRGLEEEARQRGIEAAQQEADEKAAYLDEAKVQNMLAAQAQQDEQAKIQAQVDKMQGAYDKAREDFVNSKVDPDAYMKGGHGAVGIFSALGVALAQFGSAFTGQPNVAAEFVNRQIDRSIRAQEAAINVKGKNADNMLSDLVRETGSLNTAKLAMKQLLTERSAIEVQQIGLRSKVPAMKAQMDEINAKLAGQSAILDNARKQGNLEHVMGSKLYYKPGTAGAPARIAQPTQEAIEKGQANERANTATAIAIDKANKTGSNKLSPAATAQVANYDAAAEALVEYDKLHQTLGRPGVWVEGGKLASDNSSKLSAKARAIAPLIARSVYGRSASPAAVRNIEKQLLDSSGEDIGVNIQALAGSLETARKATLANPSAASEPEAPMQE